MLIDGAEIDPQLIESDPRPCELCGCTIDHHERIDTPEGPEYFCDDLEREIYLRACALVVEWELDDARDRWRHTGEPRPAASVVAPVNRPYRTSQATVDAFWLVVRIDTPDYLADWLAKHPRDAAHLHEIWGQKCSSEAAA